MMTDASIDPGLFRQALAGFPSGVTVVTTLGDDGRMVGVEQSIQGFAIPVESRGDPRAERLRDELEGRNGDAVAEPLLDPCDHAARHVRGCSKVLLPPPSSPAQRPELSTESHRVHPGMIARGPHHAVTRASPADHPRPAPRSVVVTDDLYPVAWRRVS